MPRSLYITERLVNPVFRPPWPKWVPRGLLDGDAQAERRFLGRRGSPLRTEHVAGGGLREPLALDVRDQELGIVLGIDVQAGGHVGLARPPFRHR